MERKHDGEHSPGLVSGRIEGISIPDLLWAICRMRQTGTLRLTQDEVTKTVYIEDGRIVFAASQDPDDRLGEQMLRQGWITLDQLEDALSRQGSGKRLGTLLVEAGHLSPDRLVEGVLSQVRNIVLDLFPWDWGEYRFEAGALPTREVITLGMKTGEILLRGIRRIRSFGRVRRSVGAPSTFYRAIPGREKTLEGAHLPEAEQMVLGHLEKDGASVETLCEQVMLSNFEVYQALWALKVLGVIEETDRPLENADRASVDGDLDVYGIAHVLVELCRSGETGVLYLVDGSRERTIHVKEGSCVFATSNDFEDGLLAYLLRRGVISLRDREETAKRLLSNKRVGTILRELGVIDEHDLRSVVREQLSEIIYDTLVWDRGEYTFVPGELPTIEEITLDASIESLVAVGLRRITSWNRVRHGCGGLDARVALTPSYLQILDRINVDAEEWEVISGLTHPRAVREICRASSLGDFAVCQILWTLQTLGALEQLPAAEPSEAPAVAEADARADVEEAGEIDEAPAEDEPDSKQEAAAETGYISREAIESIFSATGREEDFSGDVGGDVEDATTYISREEVEAALAAAPADEPTDSDSVDEPEPPAPDFSLSVVTDTDTDLPVAGEPEETDGPLDEPVEETSLEVAVDEVDDWEPPFDLEDQIAAFNRRQRVLYRTIRAEVGAGAANFVRSCTERLRGDGDDPFSGVRLRGDGSWSVEDLRRLARRQRDDEPRFEYDRLIELEIQTLRTHIGESRALALRKLLETAGDASAHAVPPQTARPPE